MGNFIAVDLKVIEGKAGRLGRSSGIGEDAALAGLTRLWHRCWAEGSDRVTLEDLRSLFRTKDVRRLADAMLIDFLEARKDGTFRVRGAGKYLRIKNAQKEAARATNKKRWGTQKAPSEPSLLDRRSKSDSDRSLPVALITEIPRSRDPEIPNTEKDPPRTAAERTEPPAPSLQDPSSSRDWWSWAQQERSKALQIEPEKPPKSLKLSPALWEAAALASVKGDVEKLRAGYQFFLGWRFWRERDCPWAAWVSQWEEFVRKAQAAQPEEPREAATSCALCGSPASAAVGHVHFCYGPCLEAAEAFAREQSPDAPWKADLVGWASRQRDEPQMRLVGGAA